MLRRYGVRREEPVSYREPDGWFTALLHAGLLVLAGISSYFVSSLPLSARTIAFSIPFATPARSSWPRGSFLLARFSPSFSGVVSVIILARRRPAWFIPVGAAVAMVLCLVVALVIASSAAQASG